MPSRGSINYDNGLTRLSEREREREKRESRETVLSTRFDDDDDDDEDFGHVIIWWKISNEIHDKDSSWLIKLWKDENCNKKYQVDKIYPQSAESSSK